MLAWLTTNYYDQPLFCVNTTQCHNSCLKGIPPFTLHAVLCQLIVALRFFAYNSEAVQRATATHIPHIIIIMNVGVLKVETNNVNARLLSTSLFFHEYTITEDEPPEL